MTEINLKEYTARAKELEAAIYTQRELMSDHTTNEQINNSGGKAK